MVSLKKDDFENIWDGNPDVWSGLPDYVDTDYDITKKAGIMVLNPQQTIAKSHTIIL